MTTTELVLTIALVATNAGWAFAYRRLAHKSTEVLAALWAQTLERR